MNHKYTLSLRIKLSVVTTNFFYYIYLLVAVSRLPLYTFNRENSEEANNRTGGKESEKSFLRGLLFGQWEDRMRRGLFRYDVTTCETKIIPGELGFVAQLNEGRHTKKRPTEFRVDRVLQPFDGNKFNFTKVGQEEVLFRFEQSKHNKSQFVPKSPNVVAINVRRYDFISFYFMS